MSKNLKGFGIIIKIWLFYSLDNNLKTLLFNIDTMRNQRDVFDSMRSYLLASSILCIAL